MLKQERVNVRAGVAQTVYRGGRGQPLVWLHGILRPEADDPVLMALAEHFDLYAPIAPGYDELTDIDGIDDVHDLAMQYDGLMDALGLSGVALAGHSFGGMVAAETAAHYPSRASTLVLVSPLGLWNDNYPVADLMARLPPQMDELLWRGAARRPVARLQEEAEDHDAKVERLVALASRLTTVAKYTWPIPDRGLRRRLGRVTAKSLIISGIEDAFVPVRYADDFARLLENSGTWARPGGHMLPYEDPTVFAAGVSAFIDGRLYDWLQTSGDQT
jgi:pimeloyl-ACP methyl ester carboxylesterase